MDIDLEFEKVVDVVKQSNAKNVCLQFPDGLKLRAREINDKIKKETGANVFIWAGSCFGACDIPQGLNDAGMDLLVQWGHSAWKTI